MKFYQLIPFSLVLTSLSGCVTQKTDQSSGNGDETNLIDSADKRIITVQLREGEQQFLQKQQISITFHKILEDSRCPEGVDCLVAGAAVVELKLAGADAKTSTMKLTTVLLPQRGYTQSDTLRGYSFTLQRLAPYPTATGGTAALAGKYNIALEIKKINHSLKEIK